jgi:hypothetical protein
MVRAIILPILTALMVGSGALAASTGLRDIRAQVDGTRAILEIEFWPPPFAVELTDAGTLRVVGIAMPASRWELEGVYPVTAIEFVVSDGGLVIQPTAQTAVQISNAELVDGRVRIQFSNEKGAFDPSRIALAPLTAAPPVKVRNEVPGKAGVAQTAVAAQAPSAAPGANMPREQVSSSEVSEKTKPNSGQSAPSPLGARTRAVSALKEAEALKLISEGVVEEASCATAAEAIARDHWDIENLRLQAFCHAQDGDWRKAEVSYDRILAFAPDDPLAHMGLAVLRERQSDRAGAQTHLEAALAASTSDGQASKVHLLKEALLGEGAG